MSASKHKIYYLLQRTAHLLKKKADAKLINVGSITTAQAAALMIIRENAPVKQNFIARRLGQTESAINAMVSRLLIDDYITKTRSQSDSRAWDLTPTSKGLAALVNLKTAFEEINQAIDNTLYEYQIEELATMLEALLDTLDQP